MRICSLNQNSHLLLPSLSALLFVAFSGIFSHSFIASFIYHLSLFTLCIISISLTILQQLFSFFCFLSSAVFSCGSVVCTLSSLYHFLFFHLIFCFLLSLYEAVCHCLLPATALLVCLVFIFFLTFHLPLFPVRSCIPFLSLFPFCELFSLLLINLLISFCFFLMKSP